MPRGQQPESKDKVRMTDRNGKAVLDKNGKPVVTRETTHTYTKGEKIVIQDHSAGHQFGKGGIGDRGPHLNVRPADNTRSGQVSGTKEYYPFN